MSERREAALLLDGSIPLELTTVNSPRLAGGKFAGDATLTLPGTAAWRRRRLLERRLRGRREPTAMTREQMLVLVISCAGIVAALLILKLAGW